MSFIRLIFRSPLLWVAGAVAVYVGVLNYQLSSNDKKLSKQAREIIALESANAAKEKKIEIQSKQQDLLAAQHAQDKINRDIERKKLEREHSEFKEAKNDNDMFKTWANTHYPAELD